MSKGAWRYQAFADNTDEIEDFCAKHNLAIEYLNNGYQLRINGVIDLYPVRKKWHYLATGERGEWDSLDELDLSIFYTYRNGRGEPDMSPWTKRTVDLTPPPIDDFRLRKLYNSRRKWWQIWRKR